MFVFFVLVIRLMAYLIVLYLFVSIVCVSFCFLYSFIRIVFVSFLLFYCCYIVVRYIRCAHYVYLSLYFI